LWGGQLGEWQGHKDKLFHAKRRKGDNGRKNKNAKFGRRKIAKGRREKTVAGRNSASRRSEKSKNARNEARKHRMYFPQTAEKNLDTTERGVS